MIDQAWIDTVKALDPILAKPYKIVHETVSTHNGLVTGPSHADLKWSPMLPLCYDHSMSGAQGALTDERPDNG